MNGVRNLRLQTAVRWAIIAVAVCSLSTGLTASALAEGAAKPIKIGILGTYTGVFGSYGPKLIEPPIRLYLQQYGNKIGGRDVQLAIVDDQSKPDVMIEKARDLIENQKVDVIIGVVNSAGALAVRDYLDRQKVITLITVAGAREMTQSRKSDAIFRLSFANGQMEAAGAVLAKVAGVKSMIGIGADYVAPHQLLEALFNNFKELGGKTPLLLWSPLGTADFSSYLTQIKAVLDQADAVSPMLFGADGVRFFKQYREFGMDKPMYVFGDVTEQTIFLDQVGEDAIGAKAYWSYSPYLDNPVNNSFRIAYKEAFKRLPGGFSMHAYAAMQFLDAAATQLQGNLGDFQAFKAALEGAKVDSPAGPLFFDKDHNVTYTVYLNEIKKGPDGIVSQMPMGPMITNVNQYQTLAEAEQNLKNVSK